MNALAPLPPRFVETREGLRALACYVLSPAGKARDGRIGLRPFARGFATPPSAEGSRIGVEGDRLVHPAGRRTVLTTIRDAASVLSLDLTAEPGVGDDLPPFKPDAPLAVDATASLALGDWYAYGQSVLDAMTAALPIGACSSEAQIWPEHFDLAVDVTLAGVRHVNVGFSPGDGFHGEPYVYVGPHDVRDLRGDYWNAPFGAILGFVELRTATDPVERGLAFVTEGLRLV